MSLSMSELPTHSRSNTQPNHSRMLKSHRGNKIILPKSDISLLDIPDSIKKQLNIPLSTTNFKLCIKSFLTFNTALEFNLLDSTPQDVDDQNSGIDEANDAQQQQFIYIHDDSLIKPFKNFGDSNDNLIGYIAQVSSESTAALENMPINSDQMDIDTLENLENYHYSSISMLIPFADNLWTLIKLNHSNLNEIPILKSLSMSVRNDPLTFDNDNDEEEEEEEEEFNISDILQSSSSNLTLTSSEFEQLNELFKQDETNDENIMSNGTTSNKYTNSDLEIFNKLINTSNNTELFILKYFQNIYGLSSDKPNDIFHIIKKNCNNHNTQYTSILFNLFISNILSFENKIFNNIKSNDLLQIYSNLPIEYMDKLIKINDKLMINIKETLRSENDLISNEIQSEIEIENKISLRLNEIKLNEIKFQILINFELLSLLKFDNSLNEIDKPIKSKNTKLKRKLVGRKKGLVPTILGTVAAPITTTTTTSSSSEAAAPSSTTTSNDQEQNKNVTGVGLTIESITKQLLTDNINLFFDKLCLIDVLNSVSLNNPNSSYSFLIEFIYKNSKYYKNHSKLIKSLVNKLRGPSLNSRKSTSSSSSKKRLNLENYSNSESNLNDLNLNILEKEQQESLLSSLESNINPFKKNSSLLKSGPSFSDHTGSSLLESATNGISSTPSTTMNSNSRSGSISGSMAMSVSTSTSTSMNSVLGGNGITSTMTSLQKNLFERKSFEMIKNTSFQNLSQVNELENENSIELKKGEDQKSLFLGNKKSMSVIKRSLKASHSSGSSSISSKKNKRQLSENPNISINNEDPKKFETLIQATPIKKQKYKSKEMMMSIGSSPSVGFNEEHNRNIQKNDEITNTATNNNNSHILSVLESPVMLRGSHDKTIATTTTKRPKRAEIISSSPFKLDAVQTATSTNDLISSTSNDDYSAEFKDPNNTIPVSISTNTTTSSILLSPIIRIHKNTMRRDSRTVSNFQTGSIVPPSESASGVSNINEASLINNKNISIINSSPINENGITLLDDSPNKTNRKLQFN